MEYDAKKYPFDNVLMTGVFIGIIATVIAIFFDVFFIEATGFPYSTIVNVSSLIFSINILFLVVGAVFYGFTRLRRYGNISFITAFILITVFLLVKVSGVNRTPDNEHLNIEFRQLLSAIIIIVALGIVLIPFLVNNKKFKKYVI